MSEPDIEQYKQLYTEYQGSYTTHHNLYVKLQELDAMFVNKYTDAIYQHILNNNGKLQYDDIVNAFKDLIPEPVVNNIIKNFKRTKKVFLTNDYKYVIDDKITQKCKEITELQQKLYAAEDELDVLLNDYI